MRKLAVVLSVTLGVAALAACGSSSGTGGFNGGGEQGTMPAPSATTTSADPGSVPSSGDPMPMPTGSRPDAPPRADVPAIGCADDVNAVYATPTMPVFTAGARGDVFHCAKDVDYTQSDVASLVAATGITTTQTSGVTLYRIAYRTTRGNGAPGSSSARVYLPKTPRALPLPVIVVAHPTEGLASSCAPSKDLSTMQDLALPWAGLGYAVIAPDYAGLGNDDGVQGYVDNHDTGYSTLDAARALRKMLAPGALSTKVLAAGWSQGGGAVLSAQALAQSYGADGDLVGVIAFAPEWPTRPNSFGYVDLLESPNNLTITTGVSNPTVAMMRQYAYFAGYQGAAHAADAVPSSARSDFQNAISTLCQTPFGGYVQGVFPTVGQMFDPTFRTSLLACIHGDAANCAEPAKTWYAFMQSNVLTADASGAPILFIQGIADTIMPAASEAACNIDKLHADGVNPQVCTDLVAVHTNVVPRNMDYALSWGQALLGGTDLPACPSTLGMPSCSP